MSLTLLAVLAFAPFAIFAIWFSAVPFFRRLAGWSVFVLAWTCTLALSSSVWRQVAEEAPPAWFRTTAFLVIAAAGWLQLILFAITRLRPRENMEINDDDDAFTARR